MTAYDGAIVITGMGAVSPFGLGREALWLALQRGERRGTILEQTNSDDQPEPDGQPVWGLKVDECDLKALLGKRGLQYLRPSTRFVLGAAILAMREAALDDGKTDPDHLGITVGSNLTAIQSKINYDYIAITEGPHYVSPMEAPNTLTNAPASQLGIRLQARALNTTISSGQCASLDALGYAAKAVRAGRARQVVVGGTEELSAAARWVYRNAQVWSAHACGEDLGRPFDLESEGWLPSEGSAVAVLERRMDALVRGARPLAELAGWASAFAPSPSVEKRAAVLKRTARQALEAAGLVPESIDVVIAGANGLRAQDQVEERALCDLLAGNKHASVTAPKGTLGETYGASGLFQALTAVCIFEHQVIPPTVGGEGRRLAALNGLLTQARPWLVSGQGNILLLTQDLFGSTSAVVLRGCQE